MDAEWVPEPKKGGPKRGFFGHLYDHVFGWIKLEFSGEFGREVIFMCAGSVFLLMLSIVPIWNACALLQDFNYVFWQGRYIPDWIIFACLVIVFLYGVTSG